MKPTYGTVSRYGVISCAASGEQLGVYAKSAEGIKEIMEIIAGHDDKDGTSLPDQTYEYAVDTDISRRRVCVIKELFEAADADTQARVKAFSGKLAANGVAVEEISCDLFETANITWQILMSAETCNNLSRYDGVKFGYRSENYRNIDELYVNSRTEGLNFLTKSIILYGSDVLSKSRYQDCYDKSLRVRRIVAEGLGQLLQGCDAILTPTCSKTAFKPYDIHAAFGNVFSESIFTAAANLVGIPALVSSGVQLMGRHFSESTLLSLAHSVERKGE